MIIFCQTTCKFLNHVVLMSRILFCVHSSYTQYYYLHLEFVKRKERETNTCLQLLFELDSLCTWKKIFLFLNLLTNNNFVAAFE